jgi:hypothetical protein
MARRILCAALIAAAAPASAEPLQWQGLSFPDRVAGFERGESTNLEPRHPGFGQATQYRSPGWSATVYIYDSGRKDIPNDPSAPPISEQMRQARDEVQKLAARGYYESATLQDEYRIPAKGPARFQCGDMTISNKGQTVASLVCVTSWRGRFIKFRVSGPPRDGTAEGRRFVEAWTRILWP